MAESELIQVINKQTGIELPADITRENLRQKLVIFINHLIQNDFQNLVSILYKIDVDEGKLKRILRENGGKDAAGIIAGLIIERELQKIETRKLFKGKK
ncbi:MAG TPA: hypothetical protein VMY77_13385 [Chitinophagaceae bacterium]|nr:hypothetical protein [Chitinophagaceae bacterium]